MPNSLKKPLVFAFAADARFVVPLVVALISLASNCPSAISVIVFTTDIAEKDRKRISKLFQTKAAPNSNLDWFELDSAYLSRFPVAFKHISVLAYARILMPKIIGRDAVELIYLDCDTVVTGNLLQWIEEEPLGDCPIAAVRDFIAPNWDSPAGLPFLVNDSEKAGDRPIFNSGVLRINISAWIAVQAEEACIMFIEAHGRNVKGDQDVLNFVFKDCWQPLHPKWNMQGTLRQAGALESDFKEKIRQVSLKDDAIIHFCTRHKPWNSGLKKSEKIALWIQALQTSGWFSPVKLKVWRLHRFFNLLVNFSRQRIFFTQDL